MLALLLDGDVDLPAGSSAYTLLPGPGSVGDGALLTALDLLSALEPRASVG